MTVQEFIKRAELMLKTNTCYLQGGFGCRLGKDWYNKDYSWNSSNKTIIQKHTNTKPITFGFDCNGLVKGIIWGFNYDASKEYGGAVYKSNDFPDYSVSALKQNCLKLTTDFGNILPGELVFIGSSHVGIYVGDGEVIESTPAWDCCVQRTLLPSRNTTNYDKLPVRKWDTHGMLAYLDSEPDWENMYKILSDRYGKLEAKLNRIKEFVNNE